MRRGKARGAVNRGAMGWSEGGGLAGGIEGEKKGREGGGWVRGAMDICIGLGGTGGRS